MEGQVPLQPITSGLKPRRGMVRVHVFIVIKLDSGRVTAITCFEELKKKKEIEISLQVFYNRSKFICFCILHIREYMWILHLSNLQILKNEVDLQVGNGAKVTALAIGMYFLS